MSSLELVDLKPNWTSSRSSIIGESRQIGYKSYPAITMANRETIRYKRELLALMSRFNGFNRIIFGVSRSHLPTGIQTAIIMDIVTTSTSQDVLLRTSYNESGSLEFTGTHVIQPDFTRLDPPQPQPEPNTLRRILLDTGHFRLEQIPSTIDFNQTVGFFLNRVNLNDSRIHMRPRLIPG